MILLTADFSQADLEKDIRDSFESIVDDIAQNLFEAGCRAVDLARAKTKSEGGFGNITYNLRGSIGCVLVLNHSIADEHIYFPPLTAGEDGRQDGISYAREIALLVDEGEPVLIFCAGMFYAGYVEGLEDYDVITGSSKKLDSLFKALLNEDRN